MSLGALGIEIPRLALRRAHRRTHPCSEVSRGDSVEDGEARRHFRYRLLNGLEHGAVLSSPALLSGSFSMISLAHRQDEAVELSGGHAFGTPLRVIRSGSLRNSSSS